jgi:hypothetical protein
MDLYLYPLRRVAVAFADRQKQLIGLTLSISVNPWWGGTTLRLEKQALSAPASDSPPDRTLAISKSNLEQTGKVLERLVYRVEV